MYVEPGKPIQPTSGENVSYVAVTSGMTGAVEPAWPRKENEAVSDGEVSWLAWSMNAVRRWVVKNNFELKAAERATIQYNVFEHMWRDGQETAINFKTENQARPNGEYAARTENVLFRDNIIRSAPAAWKGSLGTRGKAANWHIINNLFTDIDALAYGNGTERQLQIANLPFPGIIFEHNTIISPNSAATMILDRLGVPNEPIIFRNNILQRGTLDGIKGSGQGEGTGTFQFYMCGGKPCPPDTVSPNIIAGVNRRVYPEGTFNLCPSDAGCKPELSTFGFADPAREDFSLTVSSPFRAAAGDGSGLGVDMTQLPQISNLRVEAGSTKAILYYRLSQPIQHIPCAVEVSRKRDFSEPVSDVNPVLFQRADSDRRSTAVTDGPWHSFVIGSDVSEQGMDGNTYSRALAPATQYHYRLMCGGDTRTGAFVTAGGTGRSSIGYTVIVPLRENAVSAAVEYGAVEHRVAGGFRGRTSPVDCAAGCEIPVETETDSVLYFRVVYTDAAGQEIPAAVQAVVIP
jgi:hypothetical protein